MILGGWSGSWRPELLSGQHSSRPRDRSTRTEGLITDAHVIATTLRKVSDCRHFIEKLTQVPLAVGRRSNLLCEVRTVRVDRLGGIPWCRRSLDNLFHNRSPPSVQSGRNSYQ